MRPPFDVFFRWIYGLPNVLVRMALQAIPVPDRSTDTEAAARQTWVALTAFQRDCVAAVAAFDSPPKGTEINGTLDAAAGEEIPHSRLYTNLNKLVEADLVDKRARDKRTNEYELTTWGRRVLAAGRDRLAEAAGDE